MTHEFDLDGAKKAQFLLGLSFWQPDSSVELRVAKTQAQTLDDYKKMGMEPMYQHQLSLTAKRYAEEVFMQVNEIFEQNRLSAPFPNPYDFFACLSVWEELVTFYEVN